MHRRTVLAGLSCVVTGCLGSRNDGGDESATTRTTTATTTETTTPETATTESTTTETTTQQPYDLVPASPASMTPGEVQQLVAAHECSEFTDYSAICSGDDARLDVSVTPTVGRLWETTVAYTVENLTDERFMTGYYQWALQKWDGRTWRRLAPMASLADLDTLGAGESHTHRLTPVRQKVVQSPHAYITTPDITLGGLGPGVYGFSLDGYFESTPDKRVAPAAVFGLAGEAPPVRPTDDVTSIERDGSTLIVHADASDSRAGEAELTVSFVSSGADSHLLPEHVKQLAPLLNTLPYAATDGIEQIRYRGHAGGVGMVESYLSVVAPRSATRYGFRDLVFEVSTNTP